MQNLRDSSIVVTAAVLSGVLTLGVMNSDLFGQGFETWIQVCVTHPPCPGVGCTNDNAPCTVCQNSLSQFVCEWFHLNSCTVIVPAPPLATNCGRRWTGFCLSSQCLYDPILDADGTCVRLWC